MGITGLSMVFAFIDLCRFARIWHNDPGCAGADVFYVMGDRVRDFTPGEDKIAIAATAAGQIVYTAGWLYAGDELLATFAGAPVLGAADFLLV